MWLRNSLGQSLLAKRSASKELDPSKWGPAVAGTIEAGQTYESNIYKEAKYFSRQTEEVDELAWVDTEQMKQDIRDNPDKYIPNMPILLVN